MEKKKNIYISRKGRARKKSYKVLKTLGLFGVFIFLNIFSFSVSKSFALSDLPSQDFEPASYSRSFSGLNSGGWLTSTIHMDGVTLELVENEAEEASSISISSSISSISSSSSKSIASSSNNTQITTPASSPIDIEEASSIPSESSSIEAPSSSSEDVSVSESEKISVPSSEVISAPSVPEEFVPEPIETPEPTPEV